MSNEKFTPPFTSNKFFSPKLVWTNNSRIRLEFKGSCLKQEGITVYTPKNVVNLCIFNKLNIWLQYLNAEFILKDCLFGNVRITKNIDFNKYSYSGCVIGFDSHSLISLPNDWGKNAIIFGAAVSSSVYANVKNKDISILGKGETKGLDNTTLIAEAEYSINFSRSQILYYNGSFLFVNATKIHQFKAKDSEIKRYPLCLGNISKDFSVDNMKKTELNEYVCDFSVDYNAIATDVY